MPKKKPVDPPSAPDVPPMPARGREVVYTIVVTGCDNLVKIERARRELTARSVSASLIHIDAAAGIISVPRLHTLWQGDEAEQAWQQSIQAALPGCLIDVQDWTPAPGYPQGELGTIEGATK
jgi:hypothetical protein